MTTIPAADGNVPRPSTVWIVTLTFGVLLSIGALVALGSAGSAIGSMSVEGCRSGQPADLQRGVLTPSDAEIAETVRGWHAASRASSAAIRSGDRPDGELGCADWATTEIDPVDGVRHFSTLDAVRRWLRIDTGLFVPGYALTLLAGLQLVRQAWLGGTTLGPFVLALQSALSKTWARVVAFAGLAAGVVFDLAENVAVERGLARWWRALDVGRALAPSTVDAMIDPTAIRVLGTLKFLGLLVPAAFVLVLAVAALVEAAVTTVRAFTKVWFPIVLTAVFSYAVAGPEQSADAVRRLSGWQGATTVAIVAGLALVMALAASGEFEPSVPTAAVTIRWWHAVPLIAAGGVLVIIGWSSASWRGLAVPGVLFLVVGLISLLLDAASAGAVLAADDPAPPDDDMARTRHAVATALAALLFVAAGVAVVRAAAPDLALLGAGGDGRRIWRFGIGIALVLLAGPLAWIARRIVGIASDSRPGLPTTGVVTLLLTAVVGIPALLMCDPDLNLRWSSAVGSIGLLAVFVAGLVLIPVVSRVASAVLMHSTTLRPLVVPSLLRSLGFTTPPVLGLLVAWFLLAGQVSHGSYHAVRVIASPAAGWDDQASRPEPVQVGDVASNWVARQAASQRAVDETDTPDSRPAVIVAASGGGIRAAYWTSLVLTCAIERDSVDDDPCGAPAPNAVERRASLLAMSGISGGSLGLVSYVAAVGRGWNAPDEPLEMGWVDDHLGGDYLAPTLAALLFNDGINTFLRPRSGVDRAAVLERAWEREWADGELSRPFFSSQAEGTEPILFLNGFNAENGCRVNVSVMSTYVLDGIQVEGAEGGPGVSGVSPDACDRLVGVEQVMWSTVDAIGVLCGDEVDWRASTAALASARFPFVSPAGRITGCMGEDGRYFEDVEVVDGGYRETSAASPLVEMWPALSAAIDDAAAGSEAVPRWCPVFLQIDNGYSPALGSELPSGAAVLGQYTAPATAIRKSAAGAEAEARQRSYATFAPNWIQITTVAHPGSSAPLGWVLSQDARDDLLDQLRRNAPWIALLRAHLDHQGTGCLLDGVAGVGE